MYRSRKNTFPGGESGRSRKHESSPSRSSRTIHCEPSPTRDSRSHRSEPSPSRDSLHTTDSESLREFDMSPLRASFRSRRGKESPVVGSRKSGKFDSSSGKDNARSSARSLRYEESPAKDDVRSSARSRRFDASPARDTTRARRQDTSPTRESARLESTRLRRCSPSPTRSRNTRNRFDLCLGSSYGSRRSLDYPPPSPRLGARAITYRLPLRELPTTTKASLSHRLSCSSRDDQSDLDYLTSVRKVLLSEPLKGNTNQPAQILSHVYIGNQSNAESLHLLRKLGVTHVLNCAGYKGPRKNPDANPYEGLGIEYYEFKAEDRDGYDISQHFDEAFRFLDRVKKSVGVCLVHCALGINRSGAIVVAYLMVHSKWPLLKALDYVKKRRGIVLSNHGFQRQLIRFARQQSLLEALPQKVNLRSESPREERRFVKSLHQAKYGHWSEALEELTHKPTKFKEALHTELGTGPQSALNYRYARFMNRDKV